MEPEKRTYRCESWFFLVNASVICWNRSVGSFQIENCLTLGARELLGFFGMRSYFYKIMTSFAKDNFFGSSQCTPLSPVFLHGTIAPEYFYTWACAGSLWFEAWLSLSIQGEVVAAYATLPTGGLALSQIPLDSHGMSSPGIGDGILQVHVMWMPAYGSQNIWKMLGVRRLWCCQLNSRQSYVT